MKRGGGAFGAKITNGLIVVAAVTVACKATGLPIKIQNSIGVDMAAAGELDHVITLEVAAGANHSVCDGGFILLQYVMEAYCIVGVTEDTEGWVLGIPSGELHQH